MRSSLPVGERNAERFAEGYGDTSPGAASRDERQVPLSSEKREEGAGFHHIESTQSKRHKARTNRRQKRLMPPLGGCKGGGVSAPLQKTVYDAARSQITKSGTYVHSGLFVIIIRHDFAETISGDELTEFRFFQSR